MGPLLILFLALLIDWFVGDPDWLWRNVPHPVVVFGKAVAFFDNRLNLDTDTPVIQYRKGAMAISLLVIGSLLIGWMLEELLGRLALVGWIIKLLIVTVLLAQKSLFDHVKSVEEGLRDDDLAGGRKAVAMIVGRDPKTLDRTGVCRAAIESLAENFSDGVVAPAFWFAIFGLPGIFAYKMINTADSMIAYRNEKYLWFGREAARFDDFANWVPARLSGFIIAIGALFIDGIYSAKDAVLIMLRDNGLHRSPNAGWPEAAMAGASGIALGGPRQYGGETVNQAYLNASGKRSLDRCDITAALKYFKAACIVCWMLAGLSALLSW